MNKPVVLHYLRHLGLGGTEKTCQLFFEHASKDFEVHVAYEKSGVHTRMEEFKKSAQVCGGGIFGVDSYGLPETEPRADDLQRLIDQLGVDILHVYRSGYPEFPEPGVHINVPHFVETNVFGFLDQNRNIDRTLFMSKWLMDYSLRRVATKWFRSGRFDYVNNPVEEPYTDQKMDTVLRYKKNDAIVLGRCGRPDNGIYNAVSVEAARLLRMQGMNVRFIVVAPPSNMVDDLKRYDIPHKIIDPTTDPLALSTFYNSIDIYAHARADGETFGVNIAEAMMHSKPVITHVAEPSVPGMGVFQSQTELVDHGSTGIIVNNNPAEYAEAIRTLANPILRESMGAAGFIKAVREYHVDACVRKLERIYNEVVELPTY